MIELVLSFLIGMFLTYWLTSNVYKHGIGMKLKEMGDSGIREQVILDDGVYEVSVIKKGEKL